MSIGHFDESLRNCGGKILFAGTMLSKSIVKREWRKKAIAREEVESTNRVINRAHVLTEIRDVSRLRAYNA